MQIHAALITSAQRGGVKKRAAVSYMRNQILSSQISRQQQAIEKEFKYYLLLITISTEDVNVIRYTHAVMK